MRLLRHYRALSRHVLCLMPLLFMGFTADEINANNPSGAPAKGQTVMLALLLDTSSSMDGLIDQAKAGDTFYFEDVKAKCPGDASGREINQLVFKIN